MSKQKGWVRLVAFLSMAGSSCALASSLTPMQTSIPTSNMPADAAAVSSPVEAGACDPQHDHCVRKATWFLIEHALPGSASPATPVFERNGKWVSYADDTAARSGFILRTELAVPSATKVRDVLIVLRPNDGEPRWPVSEEAAQTTARWRVMVVETVDPAAATFTIQGRPDVPIPLAAARRVVETKEVQRPRVE